MRQLCSIPVIVSCRRVVLPPVRLFPELFTPASVSFPPSSRSFSLLSIVLPLILPLVLPVLLRLSPFLLLSRGFQLLCVWSLWLAFPPNRVVGVLGCRIICAVVIISPFLPFLLSSSSHHSSSLSSIPLVVGLCPSLSVYALRHWVMPFVIGLCPSSLGYAICRWVMTFVVGLCLSSLWPGCGCRLAGPYSSLSGRRLSSGRRWSSDRRLSSGGRLLW